jgi:outer membrane lipoprotein-sorting protein
MISCIQRQILPLGWCFFLILSLYACKGGRALAEKEEGAAKGLLDKAKKERVDFQTISLSGKLDMRMPGSDMEAFGMNYKISIARDSLMLMRLTKIIELARVYVTRDSIFVLDKINREYYAIPVSMAQSYTGFPADFALLQSLILGDFRPVPESLQPAGKTEDGLRTYIGTRAGTAFSYDLDSRSFRQVEMRVSNSLQNQSAYVRYGDFAPVGGVQMAHRVSIESQAPDSVAMHLSHKKTDLNEAGIQFDFQIPAGYKRMSIE